jgi:hypothetical protein
VRVPCIPPWPGLKSMIREHSGLLFQSEFVAECWDSCFLLAETGAIETSGAKALIERTALSQR